MSKAKTVSILAVAVAGLAAGSWYAFCQPHLDRANVLQLSHH